MALLVPPSLLCAGRSVRRLFHFCLFFIFFFSTLSTAVVASPPPNTLAPQATISKVLVLNERATSGPIPAYTPLVTPAPDQNARLSSMGFKQETYYSCNTIGGQEHCGWHIPILQVVAEGAAQGSFATGTRTDTGVVMAVVACVAGIFALGLM